MYLKWYLASHHTLLSTDNMLETMKENKNLKDVQIIKGPPPPGGPNFIDFAKFL